MAALYCTRCGCENADTRGACLRCFNPLDWPTGDVTCSACGAQLPSEADYCSACGEPVGDAPPAPDCSLAAAISLVLGGDADIGPAEEEYEEELIGPADVPAVDFEEAEEVAPAAEVAEETVAPPPPPPPAEEIAIEEIAAEAEPAEEPEEAAEELFEPALSSEEISFAPPPPPPPPEEVGTNGMLDEEAPTFAPPAEKEEEPSFAPPAEEAEAGDTDEEEAEKDEKKEDLGGWVIDFDQEE